MHWLANMKIGRRLSLGFAAVIALLIVLAALGINRIDAVLRNSELILHDRYANVALAHAIENDVNLQATALRTALITTDIALVKSETAKVSDADRSIEAAVARLHDSIHSQADRASLDLLVTRRKSFDESKAQLLRLVSAQSLDEGGSFLVKDMLPVQATYLAALDAFMKTQVESMEHFGLQATQTAMKAKIVMIGLALVAISLAVAVAAAMTRSITGPIAEAVRLAQTVASGDLTSQLHVRRVDEAGQLLAALAQMNKGLSGIVRQVREGSDSIAMGASQIAAGNADLSQRTERQASNLQQTAASMEQIAATVRQSADVARKAAAMADRASAVARDGGQVVARVLATMGEIAASSKQVSEITAAIDGIAFQTNILALNAAVEAARAGDQGRGFAVVAGEVRSLAQRAAGAAREIRLLIATSVEKVDLGSHLVSDAGTRMQEIVSQVVHVAQLIAEIDTTTQKQTAGIGQVGNAVSQLDQATQQNAALVEQSAAAAESLNQQAERLTGMVGAFKLA